MTDKPTKKKFECVLVLDKNGRICLDGTKIVTDTGTWPALKLASSRSSSSRFDIDVENYEIDLDDLRAKSEGRALEL